MATAVSSDELKVFAPARSRVGVFGVCVALGSILMMFTALASAYIVRAGLPTSTDWQPIALRPVLLLGTGLILASSLTMALAQRASKRGGTEGMRRWLVPTLVLGVGFISSQFVAWRQLVAEGVYLASNPHSSFFYVLTGLHGLHLLGGIIALGYLLLGSSLAPTRETARRRAGALTDVVGIYWHFMGGLWVLLFLLLFFWR